MIVEIDEKNIEILNNSFISKEFLLNEFSINPFAKVIVYIDNQKVIGYLYYSDIYDRAEINQFEVENIHRNCGIGTALMKKLTETVDKRISLEVKKGNDSAINLYKKFDFVEKAIRKGYYNGIDGILMERSK